MKPTILFIILMILLILIGGYSKVQESPSLPIIETNLTVSGIHDLVLYDQDLQELGIARDINEEDLQELGITGGTNCWTDEAYSNIVDSSIGQYSICAYLIPSLDDTQIIIELKKFANKKALNGSYQYDSSHYFSVEGLISENDYGDQSRFRVNSEHDYGGKFNEPGVYYYHLWFTKDLYLIHITSSGREDAKEYISEIAQKILSKFG